MNSLIHIIGGGDNQVPLVKKAKEMGYKVLLTDMYLYPPAKEYADYFVQMDTTDKDGTLSISKMHNICAVLTDATDVAVPTVSYIAEELGLKSLSMVTALICTNKKSMRDALSKFKNNMPQYKYFNVFKEAEEYLLNSNESFIIKPVDSQGSKGVNYLKKYNDAKLKDTFSESNAGILVEEYIEGEQYSLESIVSDGHIELLLITKIDFYLNKHIAKRLTYLNNVDSHIEEILALFNIELIKELNLNDCVVHGEYRIKNNKPYLIEIACRGGGAGISTIAIPYLTNINIQEFLISKALNYEYKLDKINSNMLMSIEFFDFNLGIIDGFKIDKRIYTVTYLFKIEEINEIKDIRNSRDRYGFYILVAKSEAGIMKKRQKVYEYIQPIYTKGINY